MFIRPLCIVCWVNAYQIRILSIALNLLSSRKTRSRIRSTDGTLIPLHSLVTNYLRRIESRQMTHISSDNHCWGFSPNVSYVADVELFFQWYSPTLSGEEFSGYHEGCKTWYLQMLWDIHHRAKQIKVSTGYFDYTVIILWIALDTERINKMNK